MAEGEPVGDEVPNECVVYRVVKRASVKENGDPSTANFSDKGDADGSGYYMSVYFEDEISAAGKTVRDLQDHWNRDGQNRYTVVEFTASDLREEGEKLWRDSNDDFPGHGACKRANDGERTYGQKRNLVKLSEPATD